MTRHIRSATVTILTAGLLTVAAPGTASACSCQSFDLADRLESATITTVFTGVPTRVDTPTAATRSDELETWTFDVDAVHRGVVGRVTEVGTAVSDGSCGVDFVVDRRYLVLARADQDGLSTAALCDGSTPVDQLSTDELTLLGPGAPPVGDVAPPTADTSPGVWSGPTSWAVATVLGAVLVGAAMVALRRSPGR